MTDTTTDSDTDSESTGSESETSLSRLEHPAINREYTDDHNADSFNDFGLDLSIETHQGVLISIAEEHRPLHPHINATQLSFDVSNVSHVIVQLVGVGPFKHESEHAMQYQGGEPVFAYVFEVKKYDIQGHYMRETLAYDLIEIERKDIERLIREHTIVHMTGSMSTHWQNPDNDPENILDND